MPFRSPLEVLPEDVTAALEAHEYFVDVPVFFYREEKIDKEIEKALAGQVGKGNPPKVGVAVVVNMPTFGGESEVPGPQLEPSITIQCVEQPILNFGDIGTQKTAEQIAQMVAQVLNHHFAHFYYSALYSPEQGFIAPSRDFKEHVCWNVRFLCKVQLDQLNRVEMPTIAPASPDPISGAYMPGPVEVTLTCGTQHASIFYTTDESLPTPTNGTQYNGPFMCPPGILRVAAYRLGMVGSDVNAAWYPAVLLGDEGGFVIGGGEGGAISGGP
jgi:hypothetical protein